MDYYTDFSPETRKAIYDAERYLKGETPNPPFRRRPVPLTPPRGEEKKRGRPRGASKACLASPPGTAVPGGPKKGKGIQSLLTSIPDAINRLTIIMGMFDAGNNSHNLINEGLNIIDLLLKHKAITPKQHEIIYNALK